MPRPADIIVVGAGIVGCAIAYELARRRASVHLVDERTAGMGATQAAAGILAPHLEIRSHPQFLDLAVRSLGLFDDFMGRVHADSGVLVPYRRTGTLQVAVKDDEMREIRRAAACLEARGNRAWAARCAGRARRRTTRQPRRCRRAHRVATRVRVRRRPRACAGWRGEAARCPSHRRQHCSLHRLRERRPHRRNGSGFASGVGCRARRGGAGRAASTSLAYRARRFAPFAVNCCVWPGGGRRFVACSGATGVISCPGMTARCSLVRPWKMLASTSGQRLPAWGA